MKRVFASLLLFATAVVSLPAAVEVVLAGDVPADANIKQPEFFDTADGRAEGTQARYLSADHFRGVTQVFTWQGDGHLTSLGVRIAPDQERDMTFTAEQKWALDLHELDSGNRVTARAGSAGFVLTPALARPGKFLQVKLQICHI
jgi:hypothetical protein